MKIMKIMKITMACWRSRPIGQQFEIPRKYHKIPVANLANIAQGQKLIANSQRTHTHIKDNWKLDQKQDNNKLKKPEQICDIHYKRTAKGRNKSTLGSLAY